MCKFGITDPDSMVHSGSSPKSCHLLLLTIPTCRPNFKKIRRVVFELSWTQTDTRTDGQTDTRTDGHNLLAEVIKDSDFIGIFIMFIHTVLSLFLFFLFLATAEFRSADISSKTIKATILQLGTNIALYQGNAHATFRLPPYLAMLPLEAVKGFRSSINYIKKFRQLCLKILLWTIQQ